jgi:hypothetical protein
MHLTLRPFIEPVPVNGEGTVTTRRLFTVAWFGDLFMALSLPEDPRNQQNKRQAGPAENNRNQQCEPHKFLPKFNLFQGLPKLGIMLHR